MTATNDRTIEHTNTPSGTPHTPHHPDNPDHPNTTPPWLDDFAHQRADFHAARLAHRHRLSAADREDVRQELLLRVHRTQAKYEPGRSSPHTYTSLAFDWAAAEVERALCRGRERARRLWSARELLARRVSERRGPGLPPGEKTAMTELLQAIDRLPREQRELAMRLMVGTPTEAAKSLGIDRCTVYRRLDRLRSVLAAHAPHVDRRDS